MQHILMKIRIKPGSMPKLMEYVEEFKRRRAECDESLKAEGADLETFFIEGETLYVYKRVKDMEEARRYQKTSGKPIYEVANRFTEDCLGERVDLQGVLSFDL